METWKPYGEFPLFYEVSNLGRVRSLPRTVPHRTGVRPIRGRILKATLAGIGYLSIHLSVHNRKVRRYVHRMVLATFNRPCPKGHCCNHKDGDKLNNQISNLEWVTPAENLRHSREVLGHDLGQRKGEAHTRSKLTNEDVRQIRMLSKSGESQRKIARQFGVAHTTIQAVLEGRTWTHIP